MKKQRVLSHDEVSNMMMSYISLNLYAKNITLKDDTIKCVIDSKEMMLIAPVKRKHTPSIEEMLHTNSSKNIVTGFVFPKSSKYYKGRYLKPLEPVEYSLDGKMAWHHPVNLSAAEIYLLDNFGSELNYFDPILNSMEIMQLKRMPDLPIANILGLKQYGNVKGDKEIWEHGRELKEQYGERHSFKIEDVLSRRRYIELSKIDHGKNEIREKFSQEKIKGKFSLEVDEKKHKGGLLIARIAPYTPILQSHTQIPLL